MNIQMIKANNILSGQHWFEPETLRFFKSRILSTVYGGKYFITRETNPSGEMRFSIREAIDGGKRINTVGAFHSIKTLAEAKDAARAMAESDRGVTAINQAVA